MHKYVFPNSNSLLVKINNEENNQNIQVGKFTRIILGLFALIYVIHLITIMCSATYNNLVFGQINYILNEYFDFYIDLRSSPIGAFISQKEVIVLSVTYLALALFIAPFYIKDFLYGDNSQKANNK